MFFLDMAVVVLPKPNELTVSGSISEFAICSWISSLLTLFLVWTGTK